MKDESARYLNRLYDSYRESLGTRKKLRSDSALISSISIKNNERFRAMKDASKSLNRIPSEVLSELKENGFVRNTDDIDTYIITAKGIWEVEKNREILDVNGLLSFIDDTYFDLFENRKPLTEREKVIVFGMLSARAFSEESSVDMRKDDLVKDAWRDVMNSSYSKLKELEVMNKLALEDLMTDSGIEHPASHLIRHTDQLPRKTKAIFKAIGKNKYYLDVEDEGSVSVDKLAYLFWSVLGDKATPDNAENIHEYCTKTAYNTSIYVYDMAEHKYSSPKYDALMREGLINSIIHRSRWEE